MSKKNKHVAIVVPGLKDQIPIHELLTALWPLWGITPVVHKMNWHDGESFDRKLDGLVRRIDMLGAKYENVSLVGASAGASAALNAYIKRKTKIHRVVNVCGRLRAKTNRGIDDFEKRTSSSNSFRQSVLTVSAGVAELTAADCKKIRCIYPFFGDELVPKDTCILEGAENIAIPTGEHMISIGFAMVTNYVTGFLNQ